MPSYIKGLPRDTCHYIKEPHTANIHKAACTDAWMVLQPEYEFCPFCGKHIERDPPPKGESA